MKYKKNIFILIALGLGISPIFHSNDAYAVTSARSLPTDHRIRTINYRPDEVFKFIGHYRYPTIIEFEHDEEFRTISLGDPTSWMLNPSGFRLFIKPVGQNATTSMVIITNKRTYLFELYANETDDIDDPNMTFIMRFVYPLDGGGKFTDGKGAYLDSVPENDLFEDPKKYNLSYTISGKDEIAPIRIFDDGEFTYFKFRDKNAEVPAFYWVDDDGNESIVNYRTRGDYIVVERVSARFTLRHGSYIVCVFNEKRLAEKKKGLLAPESFRPEDR